MQHGRYIKTIRATSAALTAGTTTDNLETYQWDMTGFAGCRVRVALGVVASPVTLAVQMSASTSAADFATISGATASSSNVGEIHVNVSNVTKRYMRALFNSTGANNTSLVMVDLFGARTLPTTNASTDVRAEVHVIGTT